MRTEQISAAGDLVVGQLAVWIGRAQTLFVQFDEQSLRHQEELEQQSRKHKEDLERMSAALNDLFQQTRTQFQHVDDSQQILHARDLDILRSDLQTHVSQTRSQDGAAIQAQMQSFQSGVMARIDAMALAAASSQNDPWFQFRMIAAHRYPSEGGAAQSGIPGAADPLGQWYNNEGAQHAAPVIPPGIPHSWEPSSRFSPDMRNWKEAQLDLSVKPENFKAWQLRAMRMLSEDRPDVQRLLEWAESQTHSIDAVAAQVGARAVGLQKTFK